jgi:hypothetical protein
MTKKTTPLQIRSIVSSSFICLAFLTNGGESFSPAQRFIPVNARSAVKFQIRPSRTTPKAFNAGEFYNIASEAAKFLANCDIDEFKINYDAVSTTGVTEVNRCSYVNL